jgi:hypothetical protein
VEQAQLRVAEEDANVYAIDMSSQGLLGDDLHFNVESAAHLGSSVFRQLGGLNICEDVADSLRQQELTAEAMVNPSFELAPDGQENPRGNVARGIPYGWQAEGTLTGNSYGINKDAFNFSGNNVCWMNATPMPDQFALYQTIPAGKLGAGTYTLTCKLWVEVNKKTCCRLFATVTNAAGEVTSDVVQYYGYESDYTNLLTEGEQVSYAGFAGGNTSPLILRPLAVTVDLKDGDNLTVGIKTGNRRNNGQRATDNAGWFKVDHFRLFRDFPEAPTSISSVSNSHDSAAAPVYDLQGRRLTPGRQLVPGIYITKGRKTVVR